MYLINLKIYPNPFIINLIIYHQINFIAVVVNIIASLPVQFYTEYIYDYPTVVVVMDIIFYILFKLLIPILLFSNYDNECVQYHLLFNTISIYILIVC